MTRRPVNRSAARWRAALAALALAASAGCRSTVPSFDLRGGSVQPVGAAQAGRIKPEWLKPPTEPFRLGPGDRIEIELFGLSSRREATFVCPDGKIYFDLLPGLDVWGLTLRETKARIEGELAAYYTHPQVTVTLREVRSKSVWVLGRLNRPGLYPLTGPMTVLDAVAQAGGLFASRFGGTTEELADLNHSFLVRGGELLPVDFQTLLRGGDMTQNIYLQPDDFLYLPSSLSREVYILGAVSSPRPLGFADDMTLAAALAKAQGVLPGACLTQIAVVRGSLAQPRIAIVDFTRIVTGQAADVRLEPHDIVFVPYSPYQTLERYAKLITDTFVRTVAANEGGRAASARFGGVGVSNPIQ